MGAKLRFLFLCVLISSVCSMANAASKKSKVVNELQVLIDVSGSMKKNDPKNLRIPAIKLLINLLPKGTKVGLWLFSENTTALVNAGTVNKRWKKQALLKIKKIHSRGLFTNIEDALQKSTKQWLSSSNKNNNNRSLIILTDGMVDISKDIMQSAESRARVMDVQVPLLQQAGIKIQTIALSNDADAELLGKLASDTGGWSETAQSAEQLQKVFFKIFKQAIPQDAVPLAGNVFMVDKSIKEFSVLIFKKPGDKSPYLISPRNKKITRKLISSKVSWLNEKNYDLVTITKPKPGEWKIIGNMDPDNQVMIVTDLKFEIDELPNHILVKDTIDVNGFFSNQHQLISRADFLNLIDFSIELDKGQKIKMSAVKGKQGLFRKTLGEELTKGRHTLKLVADGKTFKREITKTIEVIESLIAMEKKVDSSAGTVTIKLIPNDLAINTDMMTIEAYISQVGKKTISKVIEKQSGQWNISINKPKPGNSKIINFSVIANTKQGESISPAILPVIVNASLFEAVKPKPAIKIDKSITEEEKPKKVEKIADEVEEKEVEEVEPVNWLKTIVIVVVINILLIAAGFFTYKFMKKKATIKQEELLSRLD